MWLETDGLVFGMRVFVQGSPAASTCRPPSWTRAPTTATRRRARRRRRTTACRVRCFLNRRVAVCPGERRPARRTLTDTTATYRLRSRSRQHDDEPRGARRRPESEHVPGGQKIGMIAAYCRPTVTPDDSAPFYPQPKMYCKYRNPPTLSPCTVV